MTVPRIVACQVRECVNFRSCIGPPDDPVFVCLAFPLGIPEEILSGENGHEAAYPGDGGVRYEGPVDRKGGPGSGHHGHEGRPGFRGGSTPGTGAVQYGAGIKPHEQGFINREKLSGYFDEFIEDTDRDDPTEVAGDSWENANVDDRSAVKDRVVDTLVERTGSNYDDMSSFVKQWSHSSNDDDMRSLAIQRDAAEEFGVPLSEFTNDKIEEIGGREKRVEEQTGRIMSMYRRGEKLPLWLSSGIAAETGTPIREIEFSEGDVGTVERLARTHFWDEIRYEAGGHGVEAERPLFPSSQQRQYLRAMYNETQSQLRSQGLGPDDYIVLFRGVVLPGKTAGKWNTQDLVNIEGNAVESWSVSSNIALDFARGKGDRENVGIVLSMAVPAKMILSTCTSGFGCLTEGEVTVLGSKGEAEVWYSSWEYPNG